MEDRSEVGEEEIEDDRGIWSGVERIVAGRCVVECEEVRSSTAHAFVGRAVVNAGKSPTTYCTTLQECSCACGRLCLLLVRRR